jgi:hypothetical protein
MTRPRRLTETWSVPPSGIAAAAFVTSAITTCLSESESIRTRGSTLGTLVRSRTRASAVWRSSRRSVSASVSPTSAGWSPFALPEDEWSRNCTIRSQR